ncbi:hypothetical protein EVA_20785, partial [gut metagenome]
MFYWGGAIQGVDVYTLVLRQR